jgi:hypothetical protein
MCVYSRRNIRGFIEFLQKLWYTVNNDGGTKKWEQF